MAVDGYEDERLAALYDEFNAATHDTDFYAAMLGTTPLRIADIGCGTGTFAIRLAGAGHRVTAVDPAATMLVLARRKPGAEQVDWRHGTALDLPEEPFDAAVMAGHAFQCLITDEELLDTLTHVRRRLPAGGRFLFETRNPVREAWLGWQTTGAPESFDSTQGPLKAAWTRCEMSEDIVTLEGWTRFDRDGTEIIDTSLLRFVPQPLLRDLLVAAGFSAVEWFGDWDGSRFDEETSEEIIVIATA